MPDLKNNLNDQLPDGTLVKRFYSFQELCMEVLSHNNPGQEHFAFFCHNYPDEASEAAREIVEILALQVPEDVLEEHLHGRYSLWAHPRAEGKALRERLTDVLNLLITHLSAARANDG